MTSIETVLAVAIALLILTVIIQAVSHEIAAVRWAAERESILDAAERERSRLVDRVIARHAGEVIALDRPAKPKTERTPETLIEGLT